MYLKFNAQRAYPKYHPLNFCTPRSQKSEPPSYRIVPMPRPRSEWRWWWAPWSAPLWWPGCRTRWWRSSKPSLPLTSHSSRQQWPPFRLFLPKLRPFSTPSSTGYSTLKYVHLSFDFPLFIRPADRNLPVGQLLTKFDASWRCLRRRPKGSTCHNKHIAISWLMHRERRGAGRKWQIKFRLPNGLDTAGLLDHIKFPISHWDGIGLLAVAGHLTPILCSEHLKNSQWITWHISLTKDQRLSCQHAILESFNQHSADWFLMLRVYQMDPFFFPFSFVHPGQNCSSWSASRKLELTTPASRTETRRLEAFLPLKTVWWPCPCTCRACGGKRRRMKDIVNGQWVVR